MDRQAIEPVKKRNSINHQNSARLTRWLDSLAQFNISDINNSERTASNVQQRQKTDTTKEM